MDWSNNPRIVQAATAIAVGEVIAYPTESVWGLGCDPSNQQAVERLLAIKGRDPKKGLILVAANIDQFEPYLKNITQEQRNLLQTSWPGPVTWLVPHANEIPSWVSGSHKTIALRVSDHPLTKSLCEAFKGPIVSTSANPAGLAAAKSRYTVHRYFSKTIKTITPGEVGKLKKPSEIRDLLTLKVLRKGS